MTDLPTLYKKTSTGAIQTWKIEVDGSTLVTTYGQQGGKLQVARDTISVGKNIGKSNETTSEEQAELEAAAQWEKKKKKGYNESADQASFGLVDESVITGGINPMLAHSYAKQGHKITWPAFVQPKLDGHRCIAMHVGDTWTLWSRTRKPITGVPHIIAALNASDTANNLVLDGELYNHDYRDKFEELTSFIRQPVAKDGHEVVQYWVYDTAFNGTFLQRQQFVSEAANEVGEPLVFVPTELINSEDEMREKFSDYLADGFEGLMVRNASSPYEGKRSYSLQKVKEFDDSEFKIVDVEEGRGKLAGRGIFVCEAQNGERFSVKMKGKLADLDLAKLRQDVGKILTVQYQGLTAYGMPRFPVGIRLRQDV